MLEVLKWVSMSPECGVILYKTSNIAMVRTFQSERKKYRIEIIN